MSTKKKRPVSPAQRQAEADGARMFGKHVSRTKGRVLLAVTLVTCALPVILGLRLWEEMPEIVPTGLIGADGKDDSLPRPAVVFALPALMCLLNFLSHMQLRLNQKRMTVPKAHVRLVGRWGFPVISVLFCGGMDLEAAGRAWDLSFAAPCVLGLALLLLGSHLWDCPRSAAVSLRFALSGPRGADWDAAHRFAGGVCLASGALTVAATMGGVSHAAVITAAAPVVIALYLVKASNDGPAF